MIPLDAAAQADMRPVPDDWGPDVTDLGSVLRWQGRVSLNGKMVALEIGLRPGTTESRTADLEELRRASWTLNELARLGRFDLLTPFRKDRHDPSGRPVSVPTLPKAEA